jgi:hypothetical protein
MKSQRDKPITRGLKQRELCDHLKLDYKVVALSAKQLGLSTHHYLQQDTGWVLYEERYYPPGTYITEALYDL